MRRARGFGLIEVLVTLLVFSIGALAIAGLQAVSRKNSFNALQRSTAVRLAESIAARMHTNPEALSQYLVPTGSPLGGDTLGAAPATNCYQSSCTPSELAAFDLWQWEQMLDGISEFPDPNDDGITTADPPAEGGGGLVAPSACITGPAGGAAGVYHITLVWRGVTTVPKSTTVPCGSGKQRADWYSAEDDTETYKRSFTLTTYIPT